MTYIVTFLVFLVVLVEINGFALRSLKHDSNRNGLKRFMSESVLNDKDAPDEELTSKEITRLKNKLTELSKLISETKEMKAIEEAEIKKLDAEFGDEIARVKKEFSRMKERSIEEAVEASNAAKISALKEVLPITDNYFRAKSLFEPLQSDTEKKILDVYDEIFSSFQKVIEVTRINSALLNI